MIDLRNKHVIITGGTHGIGETTAKLFSDLGCSVLIVGRDNERAGQIIRESKGGNISFRKCDLSNRREVESLVGWIDNLGEIFDVLINNASRNSRYSVLDISLSEWDSMIQLNLTSVLLLSKHFAKKLKDNHKKGKIINIGAVQSFFPLDSSLAYSAVKGALRSMTKSMAVDLAPFGILVSLVMPGPIYAKAGDDKAPPDLDSRSATLLGRMGEKLEVAKLLAFLASDDNSFMTGNEIVIDGGRTISRKPDPIEIKEDVI